MIHNSIWRIAQLPSVERAVRNNGGIADLVKRYIAGQDVDTAMQIARVLNSQGLDAVLAPVGTAQPMLHEIEHNLGTYFELIAAVAASSEVNEIAVAPALLGMTDGLASARPNVAKVVRVAAEAGVATTLDMGPQDHVDATIQLFTELVGLYPETGVALQARLRRTEADLAKLAPMGAPIRLCSGAYPVSDRDGFRRRQDADLAFVRCLRRLMESPSYPMVATHDKRLIPIAEELADRTGRSGDEYEFQLLYGFRPIEQRRLADTGHRSRVYLPFGRDWYEYVTRRAASRPWTWVRSLWAKR